MFSVSPYSFRSSSVSSMDLENIITLAFMGLSLILHLAHHIVNFRRSCCKSFAAICMFRLKVHCAVSSANWDREFCLCCGVTYLKLLEVGSLFTEVELVF